MTEPHQPAKCIFALRIYDWERLASTSFESRGCVGGYLDAEGVPEGGTVHEVVNIPNGVFHELDPYHGPDGSGRLAQ